MEEIRKRIVELENEKNLYASEVTLDDDLSDDQNSTKSLADLSPKKQTEHYKQQLNRLMNKMKLLNMFN